MNNLVPRLCMLPFVGLLLLMAGCEGVKYVILYNNTINPVTAIFPYKPPKERFIRIDPGKSVTRKFGIDSNEITIETRGEVHRYRMTDKRRLDPAYFSEGLSSMKLTLQIENGSVYIIKTGKSLPQNPEEVRREGLLLSDD